MRLTTVILMAAFTHVSAATIAQQITLKEKNASLTSVLKKIRQQSGYDILMYKNTITNAKPITLSLNRVSLDEALTAVLEGLPLTYEFSDKIIIIKEKSILKKNDSFSQRDSTVYRGKILNISGMPLPGATIYLKGATKGSVSNADGYFERYGTNTSTLVISYLGYETQEISLADKNPTQLIMIKMVLASNQLEGVNVVSTGYQTLPKERATGSFETIDNKLFNRATTSDVLSRLKDLVPGLSFAKNLVTVRGLSSLSLLLSDNQNSVPLIVLDNIPYEGDISNINPNDVENITILKDAAAASIWGTRAGNGVIVITTKKGRYGSKFNVSFNANTTIRNKPDLFKVPVISSGEEIEVEKYLFGKGYYDSNINAGNPPPFLTPVVELLVKQKNLPSTDITGRNAIEQQIDMLKQYDVRNDYSKYFYRTAVAQQYAINLSGGDDRINYMISGGFDKNLENSITFGGRRTTIRSNINFRPIRRIEISTNILYTNSNSNQSGDGGVVYSPTFYYPYARIVDSNGNPSVLGRPGGWRLGYLDNLSQNPKLLDWHYNPLTEINKTNNSSKNEDLLFNLGAHYDINSILSTDVKYQYETANSTSANTFNPDSYYSRDKINTYTNPLNNYARAIPLGGIYNSIFGKQVSQTIRGQVNANKNWGDRHQLVIIGGAEARKSYFLTSNLGTIYAYDPANNNFSYVNTQTAYPLFHGDEARLTDGRSIDRINNRFTSVFANGSYTFNNKYTISGSMRKDASNVFGDNANKQGSPLWSGGLSWQINKETFYVAGILPVLKLRATYGYSGNVVMGIPAYATATYRGNSDLTGFQTAAVQNPPNPDLRWEKVGIANFGLDFGFAGNIIIGSVEYFDKKSTDLVATTPLDLTKGSGRQTLNSASLHGKGIDLTLNTTNINYTNFKWSSNFIFSYNRTITTRYLFKAFTGNQYVDGSGGINPIEGKDVFSIFAFDWAGLDPLTGDPQGYLNNQVSKDYTKLTNVGVQDLKYFGSAVPIYYGSLRNNFSYQRFQISLNIVYRLGYYFTRKGINYQTLFSQNSGHSEFTNRWQKPGDEKLTDVPSMIYPLDGARDAFYNNSAAMVEKGDHIRLQDVTASYSLPKIYGLKDARIYGNVSNLGILWRANKKGIDPDAVNTYPNPKSFVIGINVNF